MLTLPRFIVCALLPVPEVMRGFYRMVFDQP